MDQPQPTQSNEASFWDKLENFLYTYLHTKAPFHLPANIKELIVKYGPWLALVLIILALPLVLLALGLSVLIAPFMAMYRTVHNTADFYISQLLSLVAIIIEGMAISGLFARSLKAWRLIYYAALLNAVAGIIVGNVIGALIGAVISLYILFEIKEYYK